MVCSIVRATLLEKISAPYLLTERLFFYIFIQVRSCLQNEGHYYLFTFIASMITHRVAYMIPLAVRQTMTCVIFCTEPQNP